jgi:hypothetical protein
MYQNIWQVFFIMSVVNQNIPLMKKGINKKSHLDTINSDTFLNTVLPNIKISKKSYPLNDFSISTSKKGNPVKRSSSIRQT